MSTDACDVSPQTAADAGMGAGERVRVPSQDVAGRVKWRELTLSRQRELLRREYEYEKAAFRQAAETMGVDRKVKRGECWFPVTVGRSYYNSLDRLVVEIVRCGDKEVEHNFEYGRSVCFFGMDGAGMLRYADFAATVSYADGDRMVVVLPGEQALSRLHELERAGVQLHFDETTYRLMFEALDRVEKARDNRLAALRDIVYGTARPELPAAGVLAPRLPWLNASQEQAVADILRSRDVMVVHGPPGTGKTTTLVEAVCEVLRREPQVLVCAQSNTAVDWIAGQLDDRGVSVLRMGNPTRVTDKMLRNTYERRFESHPDYPVLWQIRRDLRRLYALPGKGRPEGFHQKVARLKERADELEVRIRHALFDGARVVASTLAGAANPLLEGHRFHTLFIDEAAQALEAACWIAMARADRVVLAGDHCQLPPTVKSPEALRGGLGRTLMERLAETRPEVVRLLTVQYRMNEELMRFSSDWFYGGRLQAAPETRRGGLLGELEHPLVWIDTDEADSNRDVCADGNVCDSAGIAAGENRREAFVAASYGRINEYEARLTLATLRDYVERVGKHRLLEEGIDIGIISPYKAQVCFLRGLMRRDDGLRPFRKRITVNTIDAFQGQERDVMIVSLVRANDEGQIGFLSDLRRMNVALTRARMKLFLIGSSGTLCRHAFYRQLYRCCRKQPVRFR